jgi:hypothetical protein
MPVVASDDKNFYIYNIIAEQGATFIRIWTWYDSATPPVAINNTGFTAKFKVRKLYPKTNTTAAYGGPAVIDITESTGIVLGGVNGKITLTVPDSTMAAIAPDVYNYDLELRSAGGIVYRISRGTFEVRAEATY